MSGKAAGLAAATWLARRGRQFGRSRTRSPLFSGWRRFAIAGSGLAMAILASTWLFTSLLPKVMPDNPTVGGAARPHTSTGGASPDANVQQNGSARHVAVERTTNGDGTSLGQSSTVSTTGSNAPGATSTMFGTLTDDDPTDDPTSSMELQDSSVDGGPNSSSDTQPTDDSTTETPPDTSTPNNALNSPSPTASDESTESFSASPSVTSEEQQDGPEHHGRRGGRRLSLTPIP
jgi:hypothetical protein